jgi:hypothetical protein
MAACMPSYKIMSGCPPTTMQSKKAMWGYAHSPLCGWRYPYPLAGERS